MFKNEEIVFNREQLYNLVWSQSLSSLSKKYAISDTGLRKMCRRMKVPFPQQGYWQKVKSGKKVKKTKSVKINNDTFECSLRLRNDLPKTESRYKLLKDLIVEIENDPKLNLNVSNKLVNPEKIVSAVQSVVMVRKAHKIGDYGLIGLRHCFDTIIVSEKNINRSLRILDTVVKLMKLRGHELTENKRGTAAVIYGEEINISIREKLKILKSESSDDNIYKPTGLLAFRCGYYSDKEWKDGAKLIEDRLAEIVAYLELKGKKEHDERIERKKYWAKQEEEKRLKVELRKRKEKEIDGFKQLLNQSLRWRQTKDLRDYISAYEQDAINRGTHNEELINWIDWAKKKADWFDPFIEAEDGLLGRFEGYDI